MITISSELIQSWVIALLWPLTRILGMIATAPVFSHRALPKRVKLGLGIMVTLVIMPTLPPIPNIDVFSFQGLLSLTEQLMIGLAIGFSMRLFIAAIDIAGQMIGMTMGLGFASFFDPQSGGQTIVISQFIMILTMLIFLGIDGHLLMVAAISESFMTMPISLIHEGINVMQIAQWGQYIFRLGLLLSLPAVATLLIINMALGVLTRTAPQLNLFGIGFPVTISMGFLILALSLPGMMQPIEQLLNQGLSSMRNITNIVFP